MSNILNLVIEKIYIIAALLIAFPVHELSHGLTAHVLGDQTAKKAGRLTLNPLKHLDPFGTICLVIAGFGWAKPVPVNPNNFKDPKGGMAVTALSGPLSNLILGFISLLLMEPLGRCTFENITLLNIFNIVYHFLFYSASINISLCIFNLIPLPPLDGEKIIAIFLPDSVEAFFDRYSMVFMMLLMFLIFTPIVTGPLSYLVGNVYTNLDNIVKLIFHFS